MTLQHFKIDKTWALFLDRDGVINRRIVGDYVKTWDQLGFLPGVTDALKQFNAIFGTIVVVSNQQGVGKGLMTEKDVIAIHDRMIREIAVSDGRLDAVYFSPHLQSTGSLMRKPNIGMALKARKQFPAINFKRSLMVGDSLSDMIFGKRVGMKTVMISSNPQPAKQYPRLIDFIYPDLLRLSSEL
ncbi:MAG: HAD family hydrolase [Bacteroidota bacterium]|jgi:histidinol-phosphate phosphatase family protein